MTPNCVFHWCRLMPVQQLPLGRLVPFTVTSSGCPVSTTPGQMDGKKVLVVGTGKGWSSSSGVVTLLIHLTFVIPCEQRGSCNCTP